VLGKIGYFHAAPALKEVAQNEKLPDRVRDTAIGALAACAGRRALDKSAAELFYQLALRYYREADSVMPDARTDTANVWSYDKAGGVSYRAVPLPIFNEIYAMRSAAKALEHDPDFAPAVPLWLASNLRKEAELPSGAKDPTVAADEPGARFYLLAAGTRYQQSVLAEALVGGHEQVAISAIEALAETTPASALVAPVAGGAQPLVAALSSSSRRVRYRAAEALALALPSKNYSGSNLVMPVLIEAVRATGQPVVVLVGPELDQRNQLKGYLRAGGAKVFDAPGLGDAVASAREGGGVDAVVLTSDVRSPGLVECVRMLRKDPRLARVPVVVVAGDGQVGQVRDLARSAELVTMVEADGLDQAKLDEALKQVGGEGMTPEKAAQWAIRAAEAIGRLAETNNPVYDLSAATSSLISSLDDQRQEVQTAAAEALAVIEAAKAQRALVELTASSGAAKPVRLAAYQAATRSARLFGNQLTEQGVRSVKQAVTGAADLDIRNAAAELLGALNLPAAQVKGLITAHSGS
jgi:CheY-like chemotaxis protein